MKKIEKLEARFPMVAAMLTGIEQFNHSEDALEHTKLCIANMKSDSDVINTMLWFHDIGKGIIDPNNEKGHHNKHSSRGVKFFIEHFEPSLKIADRTKALVKLFIEFHAIYHTYKRNNMNGWMAKLRKNVEALEFDFETFEKMCQVDLDSHLPIIESIEA